MRHWILLAVVALLLFAFAFANEKKNRDFSPFARTSDTLEKVHRGGR
jgi:hypothetical protein